MSEKEKMLQGQLYDPSDPELVKLRLHIRKQVYEYNNSDPKDLMDRTLMLHRMLGSCGSQIVIEPNFHCDYGCNIHVGENFYANFDCVFLDVAEIHFGNNCLLGPQVGVYTATHPLDAQERNRGLELGKTIRVGDNCWIGGHATLNPGVTLGNNVVVASGAVVTKSFGDNVVIGGNPARVIRVLLVANSK